MLWPLHNKDPPSTSGRAKTRSYALICNKSVILFYFQYTFRFVKYVYVSRNLKYVRTPLIVFNNIHVRIKFSYFIFFCMILAAILINEQKFHAAIYSNFGGETCELFKTCKRCVSTQDHANRCYTFNFFLRQIISVLIQ